MFTYRFPILLLLLLLYKLFAVDHRPHINIRLQTGLNSKTKKKKKIKTYLGITVIFSYQ